MKNYFPLLILLLSLLGLADSYYLTLEHYGKIIVPCLTGVLVDCGKVLRSEFSEIYGVPLALLGTLHYSLFSFTNFINILRQNKFFKVLAVVLGLIGAIFSAYFMVVQFFVIGSICLYCTLSA